MKATKAKKTAEMPAGDAEKKKALDVAISQITKTYGAGSIMRLGENTAMSVSAIPTGSLTLDLALGIIEAWHYGSSYDELYPTLRNKPCILKYALVG